MSVTLPDDFVLPQGLVEDISEDEGGDGSRQPTITGALLEGVSSADEQPDNNIRNETGGRAAAAVPQNMQPQTLRSVVGFGTITVITCKGCFGF